MTHDVLCFYFPTTAAGQRDLRDALDHATLSLKLPPDGASSFTHVLLATAHTAGGPRRPEDQWHAGAADLYFAARNGQPYTGTSLLTQSERLQNRVLYPWRCGLRAEGSAGTLPLRAMGTPQDARRLSGALRLSGINGQAVTVSVHAGALPVEPGWGRGAVALAGPRRQTRGLGASRDFDAAELLREYAWTNAWETLRGLGYTDLGPGPLPGHRTLRAPDGHEVRLYAHATPGSGAALPLRDADLAWLAVTRAALAVTRDVHINRDEALISGGTLVLQPRWHPAPGDLRATHVIAAVPLP